jgi:hypothetical protein
MKYYVIYKVPVISHRWICAGPYDKEESWAQYNDINGFEGIEETQIITEEEWQRLEDLDELMNIVDRSIDKV